MAVQDLVILAEMQTAGRGRRGRRWHSEKGGLYLSMITRTPRTVFKNLIPLSVAVAIREALEDEFDVKAEIKWPNDILLNGRKVAGHLIDEVGRQLVLGVGINFTNRLDPALGGEATTLQAETGVWVDHQLFIKPLLESIERCIKSLERSPGEVRTRYLNVCTSLGKRAVVDIGGQSLQGFVSDIDEFGRLVLETEDGELRICAGTLTR
jgi:BirA family biotin operon repressor/biotin-[acetyl-CoA-carboxylase] ligase